MVSLVYTRLPRLVYLAISILCFYLSITFEDEQKRIVNRVDPVWQRVLRSSKVPLSRFTVYLRAFATLATQFFDRLFGKRLLSFRVIAVSICLSLASVEIASTRVFPDLVRASQLSMVSIQSAPVKGMWISLLIIIGLLPAVLKSPPREWSKLWNCATLALLILWVPENLLVGVPTGFYPNALQNFTLMVAASFVCDLAFILGLRRGLRYAGEANSWPKVAGVAFGSLLLAGLLAILPFLPWYAVTSEPGVGLVNRFLWSSRGIKIEQFFWRLSVQRMGHPTRWFYVFIFFPFLVQVTS